MGSDGFPLTKGSDPLACNIVVKSSPSIRIVSSRCTLEHGDEYRHGAAPSKMMSDHESQGMVTFARGNAELLWLATWL
jgi:hypothetical protein